MKTLPLLLLAGSLLLNLVLGAIMLSGAATPTPVPARPPPVASTAPVRPSAPGVETWANLGAGDLAAQRDRLLAEGFPPALVRAILATRIAEGFAARRKALEAAMADQPFWKNPIPDPKLAAELRAIAREEQKIRRELLGPDPENSFAARLRRQFPQWSPDAISLVSAIRERYDEQRQDLYATMRGPSTPEDREKIGALEKALRDELRSVLTPQNLEDYELRLSNTANQLRYNLGAFEPTENEFRTLFRLQSSFEEQYPNNYGMLTREQSRARGDAQQRLDQEIKAAFGDARFEEYQRARDYEYRTTTQLVARLGLPSETAISLWNVRKEFQDRRTEAYRSSGSAPEPAAVNARLAALQQEALTKVTGILGNQRAVEAYQQYGGTWIANLVTRPPLAPPRN